MSMSGLAKFASDAEGELFSIDVFGALRRRKWIGIAILFVGSCLALVAALTWPPTYQSSATILIEEPDVPDDLVKSTVSTFADDRLQVIQQHVMTTQNLSDIIDRFGLYTAALTKLPRSQVIQGMRDSIDLNVISADLGRQNRSNQPKASIAFTVSFMYGDPRVAQQVVSRLADLYLAESAQSRQAKAAGTTEFMVQQSEKLFGDVQDLEKRLADLKSKNAGSLPEQLNLNIQILSQAQSQLMESQQRMNALREKKSFLQSQLGQISPYMPMTAGGQAATPQAQLMALQLQYVDLSARYGPKHPQVVHLQKQIESLKNEVGVSSDAAPPAAATLSQMQAELAEALQKYGEQHPTVVKLRKQIDAVEKDLGKAPSAEKMISVPKGPPDNPIYIQLQGQLGDASSELEGLQSQTADLSKRVEDLQARVLQTPSIESEYYSLQQQYDAAVKRYQDFKDKETEAQVAQNMEQQSKSETFSVVEAPQVPELPIKPNRKLLVAEGGVISLVLAVSAILVLELLDGKVYEARGLQTVFGQAPLAVVPYISTQRELTNARLRMAAIFLISLGVVGGGLAVIHIMYMPLDVLAAAIINRVSI